MGNGLKLNVILHGTFAYIDKAGVDFIDALIPLPQPDDGVDHVFRAGNWLGETELRPGTYKLEGVKEGKDHLDDSKNLIFHNACPRRPRDPDREYARLIFPRPGKISSLRLAKVDLNNPPANLRGNHAAAIQVFTYEIDSEPTLRLQRVRDDDDTIELPGHYWEPIFTGDYASLQIFSAEDHPDDPEHIGHAFQKMVALVEDADVGLIEVHRAREIKVAELPPGVIADETEDLAARTRRIARLGRLRRQNADLDQAWYGNEALDGDPEACSSCGCH